MLMLKYAMGINRTLKRTDICAHQNCSSVGCTIGNCSNCKLITTTIYCASELILTRCFCFYYKHKYST